MKVVQVDENGRPVASREIPQPFEIEVPLMSLRDYIAAAALTGILAYKAPESKPTGFARLAYNIADAMLEARKP